MYSNMQFSDFWQQFWGYPSTVLQTSQIFDANFQTHTQTNIYMIYLRYSFNLLWESVNVAMQEPVKPYHIQNISSFRHRDKVHHHNNQHVPPTQKKTHPTLQQQPSPVQRLLNSKMWLYSPVEQGTQQEKQ